MKKKNFHQCSICGKTAVSGNNRSHSMRATKREFRPNLVKISIDHKKQIICTNCLRTLNKTV